MRAADNRAEVLREAISTLDEKILAIAVGSGHPEQQPDGRVAGLCAAVGILRRMTEGAGPVEKCRADIETSIGTYPCERNAGHDGDCDERTEADTGEGAGPVGKVIRKDETAQPEPLTIRWDRLVIHPNQPDDDETIVCCLTDDGKPVALILDDELREALGLMLVDPDGERDGRPGEDGPTDQALQLAWTNKVINDNATGAATVSCTTPDGTPAELQLDEEHRDALGGMLLDPPEPGEYEDGADELHEMDQADEAQLDSIAEALEAERGEDGA